MYLTINVFAVYHFIYSPVVFIKSTQRKAVWKAAMTPKQKRFCDEYLIDLNATQAAIRAGYSVRSAQNSGYQNLEKPPIREYISKRLKEKQSSLIAKQDEVLRTLTRIMRRQEPDNNLVVTKISKNSYDDNGNKQVTKEQIPEIVKTPTKISDANKAAELLGKYYALFSDRINVDGNIGVTIVDDIPKLSDKTD